MQIDNLKLVGEMPYICESSIGDSGCGDTLFWNVVKLKEKAIPYLITKISDPTLTSASVPNFGGQYSVGDIAFTALQEIIDNIPTFKLLEIPFDKNGCGYCSYWNHLRKNKNNRKLFMQAVNKWYLNNKPNLTWTQSNKVLTCDCSFNHPNGGHYGLRK